MSTASEIPVFHVVGFSGHRQVADPAGVGRAIREAIAGLSEHGAGEWLGLSSVAEGGDQLFIEQVGALGLSWHAILPLPRAEFAKDFPAAEWAVVERLLGRAEHIRVITENGTREDAYLDCGMATVDGSDLLIAVWDGEPARGKGGTAEVVAYAGLLGKPTILIDARTLKAEYRNMENMARFDAGLATLNSLPAAPGGEPANPFMAPKAIFAFQHKCDDAASRGAPQSRRLVVLTVVLHVAATLIAAAGLAFDIHYLAIPFLKLGCLLGALVVALLLRHYHHSNHNWVRCRLAAEFCRSELAIWGLPRDAPLFEEVDIPGLRGLSRALHIMHSRSVRDHPVTLEEFKRIYLERRIDDQASYYRRQEAKALPVFTKLKGGFWIATVLALVCTVCYAAGEAMKANLPLPVVSTVFYFLPIALPIIAAAFISLISINDLQRRVARYREMQVVLDESRKRVSFCQTWNSLSRVVITTERALLQEVIEWHSLTSFAESH